MTDKEKREEEIRKSNLAMLDFYDNNPNIKSDEIVIERKTKNKSKGYNVDEGVMSSVLKVVGVGIASYMAHKFISKKADPIKHGMVKAELMKNLPLIISGIGMATIKSNNSMVVKIAKIVGLGTPAVINILGRNRQDVVNESFNEALGGDLFEIDNIVNVDESMDRNKLQDVGNNGIPTSKLINVLKDVEIVLLDAGLQSTSLNNLRADFTLLPDGKSIICTHSDIGNKISLILTQNGIGHFLDSSGTTVKIHQSFDLLNRKETIEAILDNKMYNTADVFVNESYDSLSDVFASMKKSKRGAWKTWIPALQKFNMSKTDCINFVHSCGYGMKEANRKISTYWQKEGSHPLNDVMDTYALESASDELVGKWYSTTNPYHKTDIVVESLNDNGINSKFVNTYDDKYTVMVYESTDFELAKYRLNQNGFIIDSFNKETNKITVSGLNIK